LSVLQLLLPGRAEVGDLHGDRDGAVQALADLYAYPDPMPARGWVRANMVSSLDGSATGGDGRSGSIGSAADKVVFSVLRGLADVILVGAGTVRAEGYRVPAPNPDFAERRAAAGQAPAPVLAVVTRSGDLSAVRALFAGADPAPPNPALVVTTVTADLAALRRLAGADRVLVAGEESVEPVDAVAALVARGLGRVLLEGGPDLLGRTQAAGRLDELCLTLSPTLVTGPGPRIAFGPPTSWPVRAAHLINADDVLLGRWVVQR
jgi:riboflavin biosynthesis pyrimidine reductase